MNNLVATPQSGREVRLGFYLGDKQVLSYWKCSVNRNEIYLLSRFSGSEMHLSVHESGQIHLRFEYKTKQMMAPLQAIEGCANWFHTLQLRVIPQASDYLKPLDPDPSPTHIRIDCSVQHATVLHLLLCEPGTPEAIPWRFLSTEPIWRRSLRSGRVAVLVKGRDTLSTADQEFQNYARSSLRITFDKRVGSPYAEVFRPSRDSLGNVIHLTNVSASAFRFADGQVDPGSAPMTVKIDIPTRAQQLTAPDGNPVGYLEVAGGSWEKTIRRHESAAIEGLILSLRIIPGALIAGSTFRLAPAAIQVGCFINEISRPLSLTFDTSFNGNVLEVRTRHAAASLRFKHTSESSGIELQEELQVSVPEKTLVADSAGPAGFVETRAELTLRRLDG